jgi:hypothetical protein
LVFLVLIALAVSGCSGGSGTATPTAPPAGATATPAPSAAPESLTSGSIFDTSKLNFYEWRIEATESGKAPDVTYFRIEKGSELYNGANTNFKKWTITEQGKDSSTLTVYYDTAGNAIGAKSNGEAVPAEAVPSMSMVFNALDIGQIWGAANYPLSNSLPETLNINGKTYVCKKWSVGNFAGNAAVWTSTVKDVQMAVQTQYGDNRGDSWTYQLWDWG